MNVRTSSLIATALASGLIGLPALAQEAATEASVTEVIVTGSRGKPRTITSSPTPIDVISGDQIAKLGGSMPLRDALTQLVPSFQAMSVGSSSFDSVARPAGLRGMSGVHVLVLVNGKRRHNSSLLNLNSGNVSAGANPVDLDLIPVSAIERIEVLRDGAAAQYGSDAIAGVINIILKSSVPGFAGSLEAGVRYEGDGENFSAQASDGFALPGGGSGVFAFEAKTAAKAVRNSDVTGAMYASGDPREAGANRRTYQGGLPETQSLNMLLNLSQPLASGGELYANGTLGFRKAKVGQAGRKPWSTSNIQAIYPNGFTPYYTLDEYDFQVAGGWKSQLGGWNTDLSTTFGRNHTENGAESSLNASLGAASPTQFKTFSSQFDQWTTNYDLTRQFDVLGGKSLQVSSGLEWRHESYKTRALDEAAYKNGGYYYNTGSLNGQPALIGAQGAIIVLPQDEADVERNVGAVYADFALDVTPAWLVTAAARYENYDDSAGDVWSGKLSTRYKVNNWLTLRGAASNGFRAPSLAQIGYAQTASQFNLVSGVYQTIQSKIVRVDSPVARALGAQPLTPEKSVNYSLGFALTPISGLSVTVDAYQIKVDDRIYLTGLMSGTGVRNILVANGYSGDQYVRYFSNATDTETKGVDVVAAYNFTTDYGRFRTTLGYNHNETEITRVADTPAVLSGLGLTLYDRQTRGYITDLQPKDKLVLGVDWTKGDWNVNLKQTQYGAFTLLANTAAQDQSYGRKWVTDLEISRNFADSYRLSVGAYNLFDEYPDLNTVANTIGSSPYAAYSPFPAYGGYYYIRLAWRP